MTVYELPAHPRLSGSNQMTTGKTSNNGTPDSWTASTARLETNVGHSSSIPASTALIGMPLPSSNDRGSNETVVTPPFNNSNPVDTVDLLSSHLGNTSLNEIQTPVSTHGIPSFLPAALRNSTPTSNLLVYNMPGTDSMGPHCYYFKDNTRGVNSFRWECNYNGCQILSPRFLVVPHDEDYFCSYHRSLFLPADGHETRYCSAIKNDGRNCTLGISIKHNHSGILLCEHHSIQMRGRNVRTWSQRNGILLQPAFTRQDNPPSSDITFHNYCRQAPIVVFPGWQFDALTQGYNPYIKNSIRRTIEEYFAFLSEP
ncbi:hypothetical protein BGX27_010256, partial [Mortierella sp. AM989]